MLRQHPCHMVRCEACAVVLAAAHPGQGSIHQKWHLLLVWTGRRALNIALRDIECRCNSVGRKSLSKCMLLRRVNNVQFEIWAPSATHSDLMCTIYVLRPGEGPFKWRDVQNYLHVWGQTACCGASIQVRLWGRRRRKKGFVVEGTTRVPYETGWRQRNQEFCVTKNGQSLHLLRKLRNRGGCPAPLRHRNMTSFILHGVVCLWMGLVD